MKIVAMIPARMGSTRLKMKNLVLLNNKPMISYVVDAAKTSGVFTEIVINSENEVFSQIASDHQVKFYKRPEHLGGSTIKSDQVVYDFMLNNPADITVWVNPIAPLQSAEEISNVINYFIKNNLDSLQTVVEEQVHCFHNKKPVNFSLDGLFAQTQDLIPVERFVYSLMMWRNKTFLDEFRTKGNAFFCGSFSTYPVNKLSGLLVKNDTDAKIIDAIMRGSDSAPKDLQYYQPK